MTSKTDKVGKILDNHDAQLIRILRIEPDVEKAIMQSDILLQAARHALLEVIKAELPKEKELNTGKNNYGGLFGQALTTANRDISIRNQCLTEVNAILERLFK